ncbi:MAG: DNA translocase FtsK 4TM domain-containing protein [Actinobacteria bacterium]|nr:DNA translocase FtsK 4TM domain-containing protein [Actinomycetota bacterium]
MARTTKATKRQSEPLQEVYGIAMITVGVLFLVSLYSASSGIAGRFVQQVLIWLFGIARHAVPLIMIGAGLGLIVRKVEVKSETMAVGGTLTFLGALSIIHLSVPLPKHFAKESLSEYGGVFGASISYVFRLLFADLGSYIIFGSAILIGIVMVTGVSLGNLFNSMAEKGQLARRKLDDKIKGRKGGILLKLVKPTKGMPTEISTPIMVETEPKSTPQPVAIDNTLLTKPTTQLKIDIDKELAGATAYVLPPINLLKRTSGGGLKSSKDVKENSQALEKVLSDFDVDAHVVKVIKGPTVTRYELQLASGVKVNSVLSLSDDIALALATADVRILAPIPGKSAIGIEIPNQYREIVTLGDIMNSPQAQGHDGVLIVGIGKDIAGNSILANIGDMPHLLVAGATGAGKSVCINTILMSVLTRARPDQVKMVLIDPKRVELNLYADIPHLITPVVTNPKQAATALTWAVGEMEDRFQFLSEIGARNIDQCNDIIAKEKDPYIQPMPYMLIVIDELADLMMVAAGEVEDAICRIAQLARAVGIHLIIATQRPSTDIITGLIKANITHRIAFAVSSQIDSRVILDTPGAEKLVGKGDLLYSTPAVSKPMRIQGAFVTDQEIELVTTYCKKQAKPEYRQEILEDKRSQYGYDYDDPMLNDAIKIVVNAGQASVSMLQRRLRLGYSRAARLVDMMEAKGIVGSYEGSKPRAVLISPEEFDELVGKER